MVEITDPAVLEQIAGGGLYMGTGWAPRQAVGVLMFYGGILFGVPALLVVVAGAAIYGASSLYNNRKKK